MNEPTEKMLTEGKRLEREIEQLILKNKPSYELVGGSIAAFVMLLVKGVVTIWGFEKAPDIISGLVNQGLNTYKRQLDYENNTSLKSED